MHVKQGHSLLSASANSAQQDSSLMLQHRNAPNAQQVTSQQLDQKNAQNANQALGQHLDQLRARFARQVSTLILELLHARLAQPVPSPQSRVQTDAKTALQIPSPKMLAPHAQLALQAHGQKMVPVLAYIAKLAPSIPLQLKSVKNARKDTSRTRMEQRRA